MMDEKTGGASNRISAMPNLKESTAKARLLESDTEESEEEEQNFGEIDPEGFL